VGMARYMERSRKALLKESGGVQMKIMIEASVYNRYKDIVIAIDGDGSILHIGISKVDSLTSDTVYGDGITIDTDFIGKEKA